VASGGNGGGGGRGGGSFFQLCFQLIDLRCQGTGL
jgi:hypothetical protein